MKRSSKPEPIEKIRKRFHKEWLLIAVDKVDNSTSTPLTGRLLTHSPDLRDIYRCAKRFRRYLMTVYSEDWPKDLAACFHGHLPSRS